jgi:hypothetical protein
MSSSEQSALEALAAGEIDEADLRALSALAGLYSSLDPVPAGLVERIQFGITLDALHAEIAELQRSSDLVGVRADETTEAHTVTFTSSTLTVMITITALSAESARIDGWIAPGGVTAIELRASDGVHPTVADEDGRFVFDNVPRGLGQFIVRPSGAGIPPVVTPSIEI